MDYYSLKFYSAKLVINNLVKDFNKQFYDKK